MQLLSPRERLVLGFVATLSQINPSEVLQAKAFAVDNEVPPRYLETSLQALVHAKVLKGVRGPRGGYQLARSGAHITVKDVLDAIEGVEADHPARCKLTEKGVAPIVAGMANIFLAQLGMTSISVFAEALSAKVAA
jgi:Rrf2 family protein